MVVQWISRKAHQMRDDEMFAAQFSLSFVAILIVLGVLFGSVAPSIPAGVFMVAVIPANFMIGYLFRSQIAVAAVAGAMGITAVAVVVVKHQGGVHGSTSSQLGNLVLVGLQIAISGALPAVAGNLAQRRRHYLLAISGLLTLQLWAATMSGFRVDQSSTLLGQLSVGCAVVTFLALVPKRTPIGLKNTRYLFAALMLSILYYALYSTVFSIATVPHY